MSKPTLKQIAVAAGVGSATVERVLNNRGGVRPDTVEKVLIAARALDSQRRMPTMHHSIRRIDVLLVRPETTFYARLAQSFERLTASLDPSFSVLRSFVDEQDAAAIVEKIRNPPYRRAGLIITAPDHPAVRAALFEQQQAGLPIVQIVTRATGIASDYVGIDNYAAGRSAALFLSKMQSQVGSVAALCHSPIYHVQRERIRGFSDYLEEYPCEKFTFRHVLFGHDEGHRSADLLRETLTACPDLVGFYNAGGANSMLSEVLRDRCPIGQVFFIGHELTERSAKALRDRVMSIVLDQSPELQARRAMDLILSRLNLIATPVDNPPIPFITLTAENV